MAHLLKDIFKNLFNRPATRNYPKEFRGAFKNARGHLTNNIDRCTFCKACEMRCPAKALLVDRDKRTWTVDYYKCIICNYCVEVCPPKCLSMSANYITEATEENARSFNRPGNS